MADVDTEPGPKGRPLLCGAAAGVIAGLGLAVADALLLWRVHGREGLLPTLRDALPGAILVFTPLGLLAGLLAAGALRFLARSFPRLGPAARPALAGLWVAGHVMYWWWRVEAAHPTAGLALRASLSALVSWLLLTAVLRRLGSARRSVPAAVLAAGVLVFAGVLAGRGIGAPAPGLPASLPPSTADRPNVLLIVLDTVRADHLSCYGYRRETTPNIDAFAKTAVRFTNVLAPSPWTLPSHASMFTGLPVRAHGVRWVRQVLDSRHRTLAERLREAGYQTVGFAGNTLLSASRGFAQGFDVYRSGGDLAGPSLPTADRETGLAGGAGRSPAEEMHRLLGDWFRRDYDPGRPFFVFLNYIEAHDPYRPPSEGVIWATEEARDRWDYPHGPELFRYIASGGRSLTPAQVRELEALYDDEITYLDRKMGELLAFLEETGLRRNTLVILTSDHGEHFGERGLMCHFLSVFEPLVRVPLLVAWPDGPRGGEREELAQLQDLFATALAEAGLEWGETCGEACRDLRDLSGGAPRSGVVEYPAQGGGALTQLQEILPLADHTRFERAYRAIQHDGLKLILPSEGPAELYDLRKDPRETRDLAEDRPEDASRLRALLAEWLERTPAYVPPENPIDADAADSEEALEALRGLGYVR